MNVSEDLTGSTCCFGSGCVVLLKSNTSVLLDSIGLFGSRARGDFDEQSDYDIFIIGNIDLNTELRLEYDLEKKLDSEVDVIKINNETDKMFLKNILNEAIVFLDDKEKFNSTYREIEKFFVENSDFIELRERDLIG